MLTVNAEYTDTFGGSANYSWVRRTSFKVSDVTSSLAIMRKAKRELGINGLRGRTYDDGDMIEFRPYRMATVLFLSFDYDGD